MPKQASQSSTNHSHRSLDHDIAKVQGSDVVLNITNKPEHDAVISQAEAGNPTVIYVSADTMPSCKEFTPKYLKFAEQHPSVLFAKMELDSNVSPMIKFSRQNCPILIMMRSNWCKTLLGGDLKGIEEHIGQNMLLN